MNQHPLQPSPESPPVLRFSPTAWAKLLYLRDSGATEIGGFGVSAEDDLLYVDAFETVAQRASSVSVVFDDDAVADYFENAIDRDLQPQQFLRIWIHAHPGQSPEPSELDEETFRRVFGRCDWAVMFIIARGGQTYARLRFNAGPGGELRLPVEVDFSRPFPASDPQAWQAEYTANVKADRLFAEGRTGRQRQALQAAGVEEVCVPDEWLDELDQMAPDERRGLFRSTCSPDERRALLADLSEDDPDDWAWELADVC